MSILLIFLAAAVIFVALPIWLAGYVGRKTGPTDSKRYIGVGGWLTLLIVSFGIWGPLYGIGTFINEFDKVESTYPTILSVSEYKGYKSSVLLLVVILCFVQIYFSGLLLMRRERSSVSLFKKFLVLSPVVCFVFPILSKIYFPKLDLQTWPETFGAFFWMIVINGFWFLYLQKSRRIRSTYGLVDDSRSTEVLHESPLRQPEFQEEHIRVQFENSATSQRTFQRDSTMTERDSLSERRISRSQIDGRLVLRRALGQSNFDENLWSRCLAKSGADEIRACSEYWRIKSGK